MPSFFRYFLQGCLVVGPVVGTVYILYVLLTSLDALIPLEVPGLGFVIAVLAVTLIGFLTSNVVGRAGVELTDRLFRQLPLVKLLYTSIKDLLGAFVGERRKFDRPVSVALSPDGALRALGFVTRQDLPSLGSPEFVAVYFPQSYNFAGNLLLVAKGRLAALPLPSAEVMTFVVSGGISGFGRGTSIASAEPSFGTYTGG
jgi:uncharacterized membrane protein